MKQLFFLFLISLFSIHFVSADINIEQNAANFLAEKGIIQNSNDYKLNSNITRREMLKVMMNLSGKDVSEKCEGKFQDLNAGDWGCKYAEVALTEGYIAGNTNFRPDDFVTQAEAVKMILQAKGIEANYTGNFGQEKISDWREAYVNTAFDKQLLGEGGDIKVQASNTSMFKMNYNEFAKRNFIFLTASRNFESFKLDVENWKTFTDSTDWSVKFPENWVYRSDGEYVSFGTKANNGLDNFYIKSTTEDYESLKDSGQFRKVRGKEGVNYIIWGDEKYINGFYETFKIND